MNRIFGSPSAPRPDSTQTTQHTSNRGVFMPKVLVLYYSTYGHIETMAYAVAEGAKAAGAIVDVKRISETVPEEIARASHFKLDQAAPVATIDELAERSLSAAERGLAVSLRRSPASSIRLVACGRREPCTARSAGPLPRAPPSTAARKRPCSRSSPTSCISGWSSWVSPTASRGR